MRHIFELPYVYYTAIALYFLAYVVFRWRKETAKRNRLTLVLVCTLFLLFVSLSSNMKMRVALHVFEADHVVIEIGETIKEVNAEELLKGVTGIYCDKENIQTLIGNWKEETIALKFFKDNKLLIQVKMVEMAEETGYSGKIHGKPMEIRWDMYRMKYSPVFYENLERVLGDI